MQKSKSKQYKFKDLGITQIKTRNIILFNYRYLMDKTKHG